MTATAPAVSALMNSLPFDWQARRFVEINLNFFILEGLRVPTLDDATFDAIADGRGAPLLSRRALRRLRRRDGVEVGPLDPDERDALRAEIDARVARAWGLEADELELDLRRLHARRRARGLPRSASAIGSPSSLASP